MNLGEAKALGCKGTLVFNIAEILPSLEKKYSVVRESKHDFSCMGGSYEGYMINW